MERSAFNIRFFILIVTVFTFFIGPSPDSMAQETTATLSGRVIDVQGNPIKELPIFITTFEIDLPVRHVFLPEDYFELQRTLTNFDGWFSITEIVPESPIYLGLLPDTINTLIPESLEASIRKASKKNDIAALHRSGYLELRQSDFEPDFEILSVRVQGITFYPGTDFGLKPRTHIENAIVTVKPRMRIRGRVLFKDGTPVVNARLRITTRNRSENNRGSSSSDGHPRTDADGYFILYQDEKKEAASYAFSVKYMGLVANAGPVLLNPGERLDGLTFTFDRDPIIPQPQPQVPEAVVGKSEPPAALEPAPISSKSNEVWIVNPQNGHAYKKVYCNTRDEAVVQATKENAQLVTINDSKEQEWLEAVFGQEFYWIGLSDAKREGAWQWHNGEPLTYKNWLPDDYFSEPFKASERDYAIMTLVDGKWYAVSPKSVIVRMTKMAIIEKTNPDK